MLPFSRRAAQSSTADEGGAKKRQYSGAEWIFLLSVSYLPAIFLTVRRPGMEEQGIQKLYYSIGEVAELLGEKPHVLRYWESEFPILHPRKNRAGKRTYTREDIDVVRRIQTLLRKERYTIEGARKALAEGVSVPGDDGEDALREELINLRVFLEKLLKSL